MRLCVQEISRNADARTPARPRRKVSRHFSRHYCIRRLSHILLPLQECHLPLGTKKGCWNNTSVTLPLRRKGWQGGRGRQREGGRCGGGGGKGGGG